MFSRCVYGLDVKLILIFTEFDLFSNGNCFSLVDQDEDGGEGDNDDDMGNEKPSTTGSLGNYICILIVMYLHRVLGSH